jgi:hypothetical protein
MIIGHNRQACRLQTGGAWMSRATVCGSSLDEVPQVAIQIFEDSDSPVRLLRRFPGEDNTLRLVRTEIAPEIIGIQE